MPERTRLSAPKHHQLSPRGEPVVDQLVSVEFQREFDLLSGRTAERTFVKLYVAARTSGLLAAISDRDWKTLCTLATYMDGEGYCYPSQAELARAMGCSRQMANERIRSLAEFRFQDKPVLLIEKASRTGKGEWARNGYHVLPIASLRIYGEDIVPDNDSAPSVQSTVSSRLDTVEDEPTVSSPTVTVPLDTNKNHTLERDFDISNIRKASTNVDKSVGDDTASNASQRRKVPDETRGRSGLAPVGDVTAAMPLSEAIAEWRRRQVATAPEAAPRKDDTGTGAAAPPVERVTSGETAPRRGRPRRVPQQDEAYQVIQAYIADFARELNDRAPLKTSTTRAYNLYRRSGLDHGAFVGQLYAARAVVKERLAGIRAAGATSPAGFPIKHQAGYFFAVLEDLLGLRDGKAQPTSEAGVAVDPSKPLDPVPA